VTRLEACRSSSCMDLMVGSVCPEQGRTRVGRKLCHPMRVFIRAGPRGGKYQLHDGLAPGRYSALAPGLAKDPILRGPVLRMMNARFGALRQIGVEGDWLWDRIGLANDPQPAFNERTSHVDLIGVKVAIPPT